MSHASGVGPQRVLVVVPAYNEAPTIQSVIARVQAAGYPACVVNDGSSDDTGARAAAVGAAVLNLPVNLGVGGALRCAFRYAIRSGYDTVIQVDGDGQHDPAQIPNLLDEMERTGADMVIGSRFLEPGSEYEVSRGRKLIMSFLARRASRAAHAPITDATSGFRAIRNPLLSCFAEDYPAEYLGDTFEAIMLAGLRQAVISETQVTISPRLHGQPSAGTVASSWYVLRVLVAAMLVHARAEAEPLALLHSEVTSPGESVDDRL